MRKFLRYSLGIAFALLFIFFAWATSIYVTAPVGNLRGVVNYTPPTKNYTRQIGLALPGNITLSDMSMPLIMTTLEEEDIDYPWHAGIDPDNWRRVFHNYLIGKAHRLGGGSTLTQQLAKNVFTHGERTLHRKLIDMLYAIKIERLFTKDEIFVLYVNMAQTGENMYGYKDAAKAYFGKEVKDLGWAESAMLVGVLPWPKGYSAWFRTRNVKSLSKWKDHLITLATKSMAYEAESLPYYEPHGDEKNHLFKDYFSSYEVQKVCLSEAIQNQHAESAKRSVDRFIRTYY